MPSTTLRFIQTFQGNNQIDLCFLKHNSLKKSLLQKLHQKNSRNTEINKIKLCSIPLTHIYDKRHSRNNKSNQKTKETYTFSFGIYSSPTSPTSHLSVPCAINEITTNSRLSENNPPSRQINPSS